MEPAIAFDRFGLWPWAAASVAVHALLLSALLLLPASLPPGMQDAEQGEGVEVELLSAAQPSSPRPPAPKPIPQSEQAKPVAVEPQVEPAARAVSGSSAAGARLQPVPVQKLRQTRVASSDSREKLNKKDILKEKAKLSHENVSGDVAGTQPTQGTQAAAVKAAPEQGGDQERNLAVRQRLEAFKHYPASARRRGIEGAVDVSFRLNDKGMAEDTRLLSGSGYRILDEAALDTVHRAEPFPVHGGSYRFRLRFSSS